MKRTVFSSSIILCALLTAIGVRSEDPLLKPLLANSPVEKHLLDENQSLSRVLAELAAERYSFHSNRNEVWIFTIHQGSKPRKYTDKKYTVVSLPLDNLTHESALTRYVDLYNRHNEKAADALVKAGNYSEAREIFGLLLHYNRSGVGKAELIRRLTLLDKLDKGEEMQDNLRKFMDLFVDSAAHLGFADIETIPPIVVTNLLLPHIP